MHEVAELGTDVTILAFVKKDVAPALPEPRGGAPQPLGQRHRDLVAQVLADAGQVGQRVAHVSGAGRTVLGLDLRAHDLPDLVPEALDADPLPAPDVEDLPHGRLILKTKDPGVALKTSCPQSLPGVFSDWPAGWRFLMLINSISSADAPGFHMTAIPCRKLPSRAKPQAGLAFTKESTWPTHWRLDS